MEDTKQPAGGNNTAIEQVRVIDTKKVLDVKRSMITGSQFFDVCMDGSIFNDISAKNVKITNANLSDLEIEGAQLGGAYIHNIGMPPVGHPRYNPDAKQRPLRFENCELSGTTITDCNLTAVTIADCNLTRMKINGILVTELLKAYAKVQQ